VSLDELRHVHVVVRMHRRLASERGSSKLAAAVRDYLVDIHVELRAAARHPHVQWEHVVMLPRQDLVADLDDQPMRRIVEPSAGVVGISRRLLQVCVGGDHLPRNQVLADAEVLERALRLRSPKLVSRHLDHAYAVGFFSKFDHGTALLLQFKMCEDDTDDA
jgi:hypothetical protein